MSSTFAYGTGITLADNKNDGGRTPTTQTLVASEWNAVADAATSLRQRAQSVIWDARDYGVPQDGTSDCTASIQAMLDAAFNYLNEGGLNCVTLFLPANQYNISSTLVVRGTSSTSPAIIGQYGVGRGFFQGTVFKWVGADNALMMHTEAFNGGLLEDLYFWGNDKAGRCLQLASTSWASGDTVPVSASGQTVRRCHFTSVKPGVSGNGCVALGSNPVMGQDYQSDTIFFDTCIFQGESNGASGFTWAGLAAFGVAPLEPGNCKQFYFTHNSFNICNVAMDFSQLSGSCTVIDTEFGDVATCYKAGTGHFIAIGGDAECGDIPSGKFNILDGGGATWGANATIIGHDFAGIAAADGAQILTYGGSLVFQQNYVAIRDVGGTSHTYYFTINSGTEGGSFQSTQNVYFGMPGPYIDVRDGSGNPLLPTPNTYGTSNAANLHVSSKGDYGGDGMSQPQFKDFDLSNDFRASLSLSYLDAATLLGTGNQTVNTAVGRGAFAASSSSVTITNNLVKTTSVVMAVLEGNADGTLTSIPRVTKTNGSFTVHGNANATGTTLFSWLIIP